ncbi:7257_t:CDS:2 [Paraglomus occultum]|uniref:7257_t:CDS:1 n=1 Tax=Paraglomus occultum TaxID=144539 RepID=A0A9N9GUD9_9GLOM|nr:7257_t:CDS:2 [Paraglomus occultum]
MGIADVARYRVQQENGKGIDRRLGIREKLKDTDEEPQVIDRPSEYSKNSSEMTVALEQNILPENIKDNYNVRNTSNTLKRKLNEDNIDEKLLENATLLFNESNDIIKRLESYLKIADWPFLVDI